MKRETPIMDAVREYTIAEPVRFHMPGHKGDAGFFGGQLLAADITELDGTDNLAAPEGAIAYSQRLYAQRVGAGRSFYSVNGSTAGVVAAICAAVPEGGTLVMARDFHVSAVSGLVAANAMGAFIDVPTVPDSGLPGCVTPDGVRQALDKCPQADAVYVTYPNYFGLCCDLSGVAQAAHERELPLIVDCAHGAAFPYSMLLPASPAAAGADIWVESAHKTLPAMNQTAIINVAENSRIPAHEVGKYLRMGMTTSPSYILLSSIDYASAYMADVGSAAIGAQLRLLRAASERIAAIEGVTLPTEDIIGHAGVADTDPAKLVIDVSGRGITGFVAAEVLRQNGVTAELADYRRVLCISTVADTEESFERLIDALAMLPRGVHDASPFNAYALPRLDCICPPREAARVRSNLVTPDHAEGLVCAQAAAVYPPGIPALIPGCVVDDAVIDYFRRAQEQGYAVSGMTDGRILAGEI